MRFLGRFLALKKVSGDVRICQQLRPPTAPLVSPLTPLAAFGSLCTLAASPAAAPRLFPRPHGIVLHKRVPLPGGPRAAPLLRLRLLHHPPRRPAVRLLLPCFGGSIVGLPCPQSGFLLKANLSSSLAFLSFENNFPKFLLLYPLGSVSKTPIQFGQDLTNAYIFCVFSFVFYPPPRPDNPPPPPPPLLPSLLRDTHELLC